MTRRGSWTVWSSWAQSWTPGLWRLVTIICTGGLFTLNSFLNIGLSGNFIHTINQPKSSFFLLTNPLFLLLTNHRHVQPLPSQPHQPKERGAGGQGGHCLLRDQEGYWGEEVSLCQVQHGWFLWEISSRPLGLFVAYQDVTIRAEYHVPIFRVRLCLPYIIILYSWSGLKILNYGW